MTYNCYSKMTEVRAIRQTLFILIFACWVSFACAVEDDDYAETEAIANSKRDRHFESIDTDRNTSSTSASSSTTR